MSIRSVVTSFGRRPSGAPRFLGDAAPAAGTPPAGPACDIGDFLGDTPVDATTGQPRTIGNGVMAGLELAGLMTAGALAGAFISPESRGRNAAIGGGLGVVLGAGLSLYQYGKWKDNGGKAQTPGACSGAPVPPPPAKAPAGTPPKTPTKSFVTTAPGKPQLTFTQPPPAQTSKPGDACVTQVQLKGFAIGTPGTYDANMNCIPDPQYIDVG